MPSLQERYRKTKERLEAFGQSHILTFWESLDDSRRENLLAQCETLPLELLKREIAASPETNTKSPFSIVDIQPVSIVRSHLLDTAKYLALGEKMISSGRVACCTVAGGQGTRLGWNGPKGTFPATPLLQKPLFQVFAESILAARRRWHGNIPWYLMTSPLNHQATQDFFREHNWFELGEKTVRFFAQGTLPSLSLDGKILLASHDSIALNPDGHGGAIRALAASGSLAEMQREGVDTLSYFQVDNPLVKAVDPLFLGLHTAHPESSSEVSSKVVAKRDPSEKVGVFCRLHNRTVVLEYSDLPAHLAEATHHDGGLIHSAGSIAIHAFSRDFLQRIADDGHGLPLHRALKKVASIDLSSGIVIEPTSPNAIKMEAFIFDAVPIARQSMVFETRRDEEFAPIKNADGEDSAATSQRAQSERAARWMESCGIKLPRDEEGGECSATIELSPLTALDAAELAQCANLPHNVAIGAKIVL
ncbi:MAG: UTP--glucose-1-phosphate uridylyltransferase [Planctomycetota bacterium]|nr:UTP--glucose-1-phosphate uridylyltransferase [Planctomycetota bacterium]MDA1262301.1 UTP--glucose-1-phosphate uridylyltransferase [Planctomycetota bacterium]